MIEVETEVLPHASGSKFYEYSVFSNKRDSIYAVVFRWGALPAAAGKGQMKIQWFGSREAAAIHVREKLSEKVKPGEYRRAFTHREFINDPTPGKLRALLPGPLKKSPSEEDSFATRLLASYLSNGPRTKEDDEVVLEEPEIDHGSGWASW